ncbi:MAG: elongation factor G [Chitinivibrionales bacterium]|nr:elongation factor G [Chitinivibrionales bacterium]
MRPKALFVDDKNGCCRRKRVRALTLAVSFLTVKTLFLKGFLKMAKNASLLRNIGISAHIDSGKTTLTERILYYTKKIHAIHEVKGKDGVGATMDSMELERERGITITSAATNVSWKGQSINVIDTPGHVDFTIEVERALRVLDGAILVLCSVGGVQSQSITVDRQLKRYQVPRIAFVNKCDRLGADPFKVVMQLRSKLGHNAILMQIPIGLEEKHRGIVDLVTMKAYYFNGPNGDTICEEKIPPELGRIAAEKRSELLEELSMVSDQVAEAYLENSEAVDEKVIHEAIRKATIAQQITPVFLGSAYKNKGIQLLLDAVVNYLPAPEDTGKNSAFDVDNDNATVALTHDSDMPAVCLAFKLEDGAYGQLTYIRIYQGSLSKGDELVNSRTGRKIKVGRLIRMHADSMEDISRAPCGDIVALFGVDCASGDTFCHPSLHYTMSQMHIPEPVISLAIQTKDKKGADAMSKALNRFTKEDPTFRTYIDPESNQTIIKGMGELHLEIYIERMRREYGVELTTGMPQVAYRETILNSVAFDYTHKKQTGGAGQYGRVAGMLEPTHESAYEFVDDIKGGVIPREFINSCDKGFRACLSKGSLIGFPILGVKVTINDGNYHPVDSSDNAFMNAAIGAFRQAYNKAKVKILEPIMKVNIEGPAEFQGNVLATINQRRGIIISTTEDNIFARVEAEVPLSEMFGYSTTLRSQTQGKSEFSMEFLKYGQVPDSIAEKLMKEYQEKKRQ